MIIAPSSSKAAQMSDAAKKIMDDFLKGHYQNLNSIAWLIKTKYDIDTDADFPQLVPLLSKNATYFERIKNPEKGNKNKALLNLRNSWYNEAAFLDRSLHGVSNTKFLPWKIAKFYYSMFTALSSVARCIDGSPHLDGHERMINFFTNSMLMRKELRNVVFSQPFCFVLNSHDTVEPAFEDVIDWSHGLKFDCPTVETCLKGVQAKKSKKKNISLFHYFLDLRIWANYEGSYIFRRLYGETVRPSFYQYLYLTLSTFLSQVEIFLIWVFGYDTIHEEQALFVSEFNKYFEPETSDEERVTYNLSKRFEYYDNYKNNLLS